MYCRFWILLLLAPLLVRADNLVVTFSGLAYFDAATLASGFATELAALSNSTAAADDVLVSSVVDVNSTSTVVSSTVQLTAAQILQQFLASDDAQKLDAVTFPIFSTTSRVVVVSTDAPTTAAYDTTCNNGATCGGIGACVTGLCACIADAQTDVCSDDSLPFTPTASQQCVGGASSHYADVCASTASTVDRLVYGDDTCASRHVDFVNLYPMRRFCQSRNYAASADRNVFIGILGDAADSNVAGLRLFTVSTPSTMDQLNSTRDSATGVVALRAYVSNLYDNAAPVASKVWAHVEFTTLVSATVDNSSALAMVQLTRLAFLDSIEGDRRYYFQANRWHAYPNDSLPTGSYAYWDADGGQVAWACQLWHVYNPATLECEPGCDNGLTGADCDTPLTAACVVRSFNATTTLYVGYTCDSIVCRDGYQRGAFACELPPNGPIDNPIIVVTSSSQSSSSSSSVDVVVIVAICAAIFAAAGVTLSARALWHAKKKAHN